MNSEGRDVFVVYGRNRVARDAMFQFLRAVGLHPLEWEELTHLTQMATPWTWQSVEKGVDRAQAVVVLMTGDDIVSLRPEYGASGRSYQPRPNVLIEAGYALAKHGAERTLFVKPEHIRSISDVDGLNFLNISNDAEKRSALRERLRNAGCLVNESTDYLNPAISGNFEDAFSSDDDDGPDVLERGEFNDHIVDSSISYKFATLIYY